MKYLCIKQPTFSSSLFKRFTKGNVYESCCDNPYYLIDNKGSGCALCNDSEFLEYFKLIKDENTD